MNSRRAASLCFLLLAATFAAAALPRPPAAAQAAPIGIDARIAPSVGPGQLLDLDVRIQNRTRFPLRDLRVGIAIYERVRSRSELQQIFEGEASGAPLEVFSVRAGDLEPGATTTVDVRRPFDALDTLVDAPEGVYPVAVSVRRSAERAMEEVTTAVTVMDGPAHVPLRLLPVVSVLPAPLLLPDGTLTHDALERIRTIEQTLDELSRTTGGLAVTATALNELELLESSEREDVAEAATDALGAAGRVDEYLLAPRTPALLPHAGELGRSAGQELAEGTAALEDTFGRSPTPLLYAPGLLVDDTVLPAAAVAGARGALIPGDVLDPQARLTPAVPVRADDLLLVPADHGLGDAVAQSNNWLTVGRAVADTAMVFFESPGRRRSIAVDVTATAPGAADFLAHLRDAPWLELTTPSEAVSADGRTQQVRLPTVPPPPPWFLAQLRDAEQQTSTFARITFEDNPVRPTFEHALDMSSGTLWWHEDWRGGRAWVQDLLRAIDDEQRFLRVSANTVTFTSRSGEVPVTIANNTTYPVRLRVVVSSPKLSFPEGDTRTIERLEPPGDTLLIPALADATGNFPLTVTLETVDGEVVIASEELLVRSTAANVVALALTVGAALFLLGAYGRRVLGARRGSADGTAE